MAAVANPVRRCAAEWLGTCLLLATVVGSGIMAERLAGGSVALALLGNTLATGAMLTVLIMIFGPVSGAHFNPAVTAAFMLRREQSLPHGVAYMAVQVGGAVCGVWLAHLMFDVDVLQRSARLREGPAQWLSEAVATFGLVFTILGCLRWGTRSVAAAVGLYIAAAYWFTASTSFANPAVTIARSLTDSFSGIAAGGVPAFIAAQFAGGVIAVAFAAWLYGGAATPADADLSSGSRPR